MLDEIHRAHFLSALRHAAVEARGRRGGHELIREMRGGLSYPEAYAKLTDWLDKKVSMPGGHAAYFLRMADNDAPVSFLVAESRLREELDKPHEPLRTPDPKARPWGGMSGPDPVPADADFIYVCSPYRGNEKLGTSTIGNTWRAAVYTRHVVKQGFAPITSHLYLPIALDDQNEEERALGLAVAKRLITTCHQLWVFLRPGEVPTEGMEIEIAEARRVGVAVIVVDPQTVMRLVTEQSMVLSPRPGATDPAPPEPARPAPRVMDEDFPETGTFERIRREGVAAPSKAVLDARAMLNATGHTCMKDTEDGQGSTPRHPAEILDEIHRLLVESGK